MSAVFVRQGEATPASALPLPPSIDAALWRGSELGSQLTLTVPSGWAALDAELPGNGWPTRGISEVLSPQPAVTEWRLLAPALRTIARDGGNIVVIGPPRQPHIPGLAHEAIDAARIVWIKAEAPAQRLWVTEQLIKSNAAAAVVAWLPQARQEQIRRLQVCAQGCEGLVFLCRPEAAKHDSSAAPLRVHVTYGLDWELHAHIVKRRGPMHDGVVTLSSVPGGLAAVLTPRLQRPSRLLIREAGHVVGRAAPRPVAVRALAAH